MQPIKITIQGDYIDCQIYRGNLYLWTFDGEICCVNWNLLIDSLQGNTKDPNTLNFAFTKGSFLYDQEIVELFNDNEYKKLLNRKFTNLSKVDYQFSELEIEQHISCRQDYTNNQMPTDTEIYNNKIYSIDESGLYSSNLLLQKRLKRLHTSTEKLWDCNLLSIKANKYPQLALSGGTEGLYELDISDNSLNYFLDVPSNEPKQISSDHSSFANYSYWSIYNTSLVEESKMKLFSLEKLDSDDYDEILNQKKYKREYLKTISENEIFKSNRNQKTSSNCISWGGQDRIYRTTDEGVEIVKFNNFAKEDSGQSFFAQTELIHLMPWKGNVISGGSSYFGSIIECENALVLLLSNGKTMTINGPVTRWRTYPRSINYENHLHVILEDRIEIYSFNHDYFLNQKEKQSGTEYRGRKRFGY